MFRKPNYCLILFKSVLSSTGKNGSQILDAVSGTSTFQALQAGPKKRVLVIWSADLAGENSKKPWTATWQKPTQVGSGEAVLQMLWLRSQMPWLLQLFGQEDMWKVQTSLEICYMWAHGLISCRFCWVPYFGLGILTPHSLVP